MSGRMKGQMLLAQLLIVSIFLSDSEGWPDNGTSVTPTTGTESFTESIENGTSVIPTNETAYSTESIENGTSVIPTNKTEYSTGWPEYGVSVTPTAGTEPTSDPPLMESSKTTRSAPNRKVEIQPHYRNFKEADNAEGRFHYDYHSLRISGLVMAAVFFLMGILILLVSFPRCCSCRIRKGRTYNVVQLSQNPVQETRKDSEVTLLDSGITAV